MKYLPILLILAGCTGPISPDATPWQLESARSIAASTLAAYTLAEPLPPDPDPRPGPDPVPPLPGEKCEQCNGTGKLRPDNRIEVDCWYCDGDGRMTLPELSAAVAKVEDEREEQAKEIKKAWAELAAMREKPEPKRVVTKPIIGETVKWWTSGKAAADEAKATGKPAFIFFTMDGCSWCVKAERECFANPSVIKALDSFICIKVNRRDVSSANLKSWEIEGFPSFRVVRSDWKAKKSLEFSGADNCLNQLDSALAWANQTLLPKVQTTSAVPRAQSVRDYHIIWEEGYDGRSGCSSGSCGTGYGGYYGGGGGCSGGGCGG